MPMFTFECESCGESTEFFEHRRSDLETPDCPSCEEAMQRSYGGFSTGSSSRSSDSSENSMPGSLQEHHPKDMINNVANSYKASGQEPSREFNEAVDRINKGENPDKVHDFVKDAKSEVQENSSSDSSSS